MKSPNRTVRASQRIRYAALSGLAALTLLTACASVPPPREELAVSKAAVERANGGAATEAPVELAMARDKLERANLAMGKKDYVDARRLAEQAEADANLAEAKARSVRATAALHEVRDGIRMLRDEMDRRARG